MVICVWLGVRSCVWFGVFVFVLSGTSLSKADLLTSRFAVLGPRRCPQLEPTNPTTVFAMSIKLAGAQ